MWCEVLPNENIDDLSLTYDGNRLIKVTDDADPVLLERSCDFYGKESVYGYNADGALYSDTSRGIEAIEYAPAGQPVAIRDTDGILIARYAYSADGRRLSSGYSTVPGQEPTGNRHFIGSFEVFKYDRDIMNRTMLERIRIPWGEILYDNTALLHMRDYQGNVCAVIEPVSGGVAQTTEYYPYGLPTASSTGQVQNTYKFSGKSFEAYRGMNRYDFHARQYDPALGLFDCPDPMAAEYPWLNPYLYCAANPVMHIDPTGRDTYVVDLNGYFKLSETTTDDFDRIMSIMGSCPHMDVSKSFLSSLHEIKGTLKSSDGSPTENIIISMYNGASISNELHEFLAANTDVEWSYSEMKTLDGNIDKYIGTTHLSNSDASPDIMLETAITNNVMDILFVHNHSIGNTTVSQGDINFAIKTQTKFPNAKFSIIFPNSNLPAKFYDRNSTAGLLQEAICIGKR